MYSIPQLVVPPLIPFVVEIPVAAVLDWPWGLLLAAWLSLAALVGMGLGVLRERTSGHTMPRVDIRQTVRGRRTQLRHA